MICRGPGDRRACVHWKELRRIGAYNGHWVSKVYHQGLTELQHLRVDAAAGLAVDRGDVVANGCCGLGR